MKKTLVFGVATAALLLSVGACNSSQHVAALYGPPPDDVIEPSDEPEDIEEIDEPIEDVYGPPVDVDDDFSEIEALYGPPPEDDEPTFAG